MFTGFLLTIGIAILVLQIVIWVHLGGAGVGIIVFISAITSFPIFFVNWITAKSEETRWTKKALLVIATIHLTIFFSLLAITLVGEFIRK